MPPIDLTSKLARIGPTGSGSKTQGAPPRGKTQEALNGTPKESTSVAGQAGQVHLSGAARQLLENPGSPVDVKRVAKIHAAVANGSYQIDTHSVAQKIANNLAAMARRKSGK